MQLLWDRGEANGYAQHMTSDPLPNTPAHHVLLQMAYGDHQVSNLAGEVEARTIGAQVHTPELDAGRHWGVDPLFGLTPIGSYPYSGSAAMVYYDGGPLNFTGSPAQTCTDEHSVTTHGTAPAPTGGAAAESGQRVRLRPAPVPAALGRRRGPRSDLAVPERVDRPVRDTGHAAAVLLERLHRVPSSAELR